MLEKTDEEYGITFKIRILKLVILIPEAAALPSLHMPGPKNERKEQCLWKGDPNANLWAPTWFLQPIPASLREFTCSLMAWDLMLLPRMTEWGVMDSKKFCNDKALESHFMIKINSNDLTNFSRSVC
uniref:Uncharacterized protein n=1 Tax=Molossus molossus TaxID=27622 RepID=A0A7J8JX50_MOLMO|nr:hypothetical protein HJG59_008038 [Molossus molossus]